MLPHRPPQDSQTQLAPTTTNPTLRFTPIAFEVQARTKVRWPSQGLGDVRPCDWHMITPLHSALLQSPHRLDPTTPDPTPWTSLHHIEGPHEIPGWNTPQWPWVTWLPPEIMWASRNDRVTTCHLVSRPL